MSTSNHISHLIKGKAEELGFLECIILPVRELADEEKHLKKWLKNEMHGEMDYMARNVEKRLNPELLVEGAKTIIIVLQNYFPKTKQKEKDAPVISKYAYGTDYHFVTKAKLKKLLTFIQNEIPICNGRPFVDSAPVLERAWAKHAGLGWIGKNSNLISVTHGSFFFIGELLLDTEIPYDTPKLVRDHCRNCTRCVDACPTKAIIADYIVDARKCISYQTIELKGELDKNLQEQFENRVFGCDICQDVCPWNLKSKPHNEPNFEPHPKLLDFSKKEWFNIEKPLFDDLLRTQL